MPPFIAFLATLALIIWLLRTDFRLRTTGSTALWIPGLWLLVAGSRPVSYWFGMLGLGGNAETDTDSNPSNTILYGILIVAAFIVLARRRFRWSQFFGSNAALTAVYLYLALSSLWAPESFVTFRRLLKDFGCVPVALVVLTEPDPWFACRAIFFRASCFLLPLSLVLSKYYPAIGRYSSRSGDSFYTGLTTHKNTLGQVVFLCLLFLVLDLMEILAEFDPRNLRLARRIRYLIIGIGLSLMYMSESVTSQICLTVGTFFLITLRKLPAMKNGRRIFRVGVIVLILAVLADGTLDISGSIVELLGRNKTLTGRSLIWTTVLNHQPHIMNGYGYYAFWDTPMANVIYEEAGDFIHVRTVHNGYLEMYIDGGLVGVVFLGLFVLASGRTAYRRLFASLSPISMPLTLWIITVVYNNSESSFFRLDMLWFTFLLVTLKCPGNDPTLASPDRSKFAQGGLVEDIPIAS